MPLSRFRIAAATGLLLLCSGAHANVQSDINKFFDNMGGGGGNYTSGAAWQGQSAGYLTGGNLFVRMPVRNIQLISVTLPDIKSGCGGIDAYLGSFSFINGDAIKVLGKQILSNAAGYAFDLGLETICPQCKAVKDYLQKLSSDVNNMNISTCQAAQSIVGGLWPKTQAASAQICQDIGTQHDVFSDWAASRQGCGVGGETNSVFNKASDDEKKRIPRNRNLTWETFSKLNQFFSSDRSLKEFLMSMVGTVIYDANGNPTFLQPRGGSESMFNTLLNGGTEKIYRCDNDTTCLSPTIVDFTLADDEAMTARVRDMLDDIFAKSRSDTPLTDDEKALINSTRVRILRYTIDSASVGLDSSVVSSLAEYIASDMVLSYVNGLIDVAATGAAGTLDTEEENKHFQDNLRTVRSELSQRVARINVQQNGLAEYERSLSQTRQQLSSSVSDSVLSNYDFGGNN
ncbi:conjugal transfer protein TraH [Candidatus Pantoea multigeneris]|uniref:Conjugal transfer protein TraH n=1 Tax=Candidatus Pantoea multigeneris TaxID=2608357 RepID=A0ABX0RIF8_9GAMM|nr:conjugal transfer protein TraH [Pantoea multigeneris]NIF23928.1 conjugal transfer protein TraH [Pantoea multigeneris]